MSQAGEQCDKSSVTTDRQESDHNVITQWSIELPNKLRRRLKRYQTARQTPTQWEIITNNPHSYELGRFNLICLYEHLDLC